VNKKLIKALKAAYYDIEGKRLDDETAYFLVQAVLKAQKKDGD
jgi:hypothetical protein